jgi:hypothetical protein
MGRRKKIVLSILAVSGLMGLAFGATGSAFAGTNGQVINFCANGSDYQDVYFDGRNQNGDPVKGSFWINLHPGECNDLKGYYWAGEVKLTWMNSESKKFARQETTCNVPREYSGDSYTCMPKALM